VANEELLIPSLPEAVFVGLAYLWRKQMAKPKFLAVALITATTLAAPALAAGKHVGSRHTTADAHASAAPVQQSVGACIPAPRRRICYSALD
jgi:hypothetical protein